jgi:hypothetical protein
VSWGSDGLELKVSVEHHYGNIAWKISNEPFYFSPGVAFTMVGDKFAARAHPCAARCAAAPDRAAGAVCSLAPGPP